MELIKYFCLSVIIACIVTVIFEMIWNSHVNKVMKIRSRVGNAIIKRSVDLIEKDLEPEEYMKESDKITFDDLEPIEDTMKRYFGLTYKSVLSDKDKYSLIENYIERGKYDLF